ncbi:MAG TPA: hypothetical protein H9846_00220 [Candidatus Gemmiger excrementipullorum]|uniref:Uncharacterized protein n=1 Tax=Candidatus Gemmiger excrementipullorum TaxID=2838610 RepID=A0A9D1XZ22_9FIRM|nr:hypothetical protein [Candidatus Gemmiger excrementipullorum]
MHKIQQSGWRARLWQAAPWLWIAAGYLLDLWYQLVPGKWIVDSDLASEMILADLLNQEGTVISSNWYYSTELKVVNLQWFYRLGLLLFPDSWHLARVFGMAIALALYTAVLLFFVRSAGLGRAGLWMTGALLWPFGRNYLVLALYGGYYLVYTSFYLLVLALILRALRASRAAPWLAAACAVAAVSGTNGVKQLMVFHAPLLAASAVLLALALHRCGKTTWREAWAACRLQVRMLAASLLTALGCAAGYFLSDAVLSRLYDFKSYGFIAWNRSDDWFTLDRILMDFFHEFGYQDGANLFRFSGIATGIGLLLGLCMFLCIVRLLLRLCRLQPVDQLLVLLLVCMLAVCSVCYTYFQEYYGYFWLLNLPVGVAVMAVELKTEDFRLPGARQLAAAALACAFTVCAVHTVRREIEKPALAHKGLDTVAAWLVDNGYTEGYATFWNGNAMIELSSGKLDVWTLASLSDDKVPDWLQKKDHLTTDPAGSPFLLLDTEGDGAPEDAALITRGNCELVYEDSRYQVYTFASAADVHAAAEAARAEG